MTHVSIKSAPGGAYQLIVDGVDLSMHVLAGVSVELPEELGQPALVRLVVPADTVEVDLPDALAQAVLQGEGRRLQRALRSHERTLQDLERTASTLAAAVERGSRRGASAQTRTFGR